MRVIYMGTPEFAVPALEALVMHHTVALVVTQPDRQKGRGKVEVMSPVKEFALKAGLPVFQPERIKARESIEELEKHNADVIVVAAYGQILPKAVLELTKYGCINVHGSLLPRWRGAAPIQMAIISGDTHTGITTMQMDAGVDTGDMLLKSSIPIEDNDTYGTLHDKLAAIGADILIQTLDEIENGKLKPTPQNHAEFTYAPMLKKDDGLINWNKSTSDLLWLIRGLNPWPSAYTYYKEDMLKIWNAEAADSVYGDECPGEIIEIVKNKGFVVKTADGGLMVTEVQGKGGKRMSAGDYMRGHEILTHVKLLRLIGEKSK